MKELNLVLLGAPGSGKGTLAAKLGAKFGIPHISTGDLVREEISRKTPLGKQVEETVKSGGLVDDCVVKALLLKRLCRADAKKGFILDGFPRNLDQAESLAVYVDETKKRLNAVLYLKVPKKEIIKRISGRRQCSECGAVYNIYSNPPKKEKKCDRCGGRLYRRKDDSPKIVESRWKAYIYNTQPLIDYYKKKRLLLEVDMLGSVEENFLKALKALEGIK